MPKLTQYCPPDLFFDNEVWSDFLAQEGVAVAMAMNAKNPDGELVVNDPVAHIDIITVEYDPKRSRPTAVVLIEVITYAWEDRMADINARLGAIADFVSDFVRERYVVPEGMDAVSVTFLGKGPGCWVAK